MDEFDLIRILDFRLRVENLLNSKYGYYMEAASCIASLLSSSLYVVSTYTDAITFLNEIDVIVFMLFSFEFILKFYVSQHRLHYLTEI